MIITTGKEKSEDNISEDGIDFSSIKSLIYSHRNFSILNNIDIYCNVVYLDLSSNKLQSVDSINSLKHLSFLNLENNNISSLAGICDFPALENLNLSNNSLSWRELEKIRYMHIVQLQLSGNSPVVKDQYYRQHVLDSLPNVWCLDGSFASSSERIRVHRFFQKSAFTSKPVRHKCKDSVFTPTNMQNKRLRGVFGKRTMKFLLLFPDTAILNAGWDKRKLNYLGNSVQYQLSFMSEALNYSEESLITRHPEFLNDLLNTRTLSPEHNDRFHILLLLLIGSSLFRIPQELFKDCLTAFSLSNYGSIDMSQLFDLPTEMKLEILLTMMAAAKIDYDAQNSPLYKELAIALSLSVNHLFLRISRAKQKSSCEYSQCQSLLAAELSIQFGALPEFYEMLLNEDVLEFLAVATGNGNFPIELLDFARKKEIELKGNVVDLYDNLDNFIGEAVNVNINTLITQGKITKYNIFLEPRALLNPEPRSLFSAPYLVKGLTPPNRSYSSLMLVKPVKQRSPNLGEEVLIGPQNIARILSLPGPNVALIQMPHVPLSNGGMRSVATNANDHYAYINVDTLQWDANNRRWKPKGSQGDKISLRVHANDPIDGDPSLMKSHPVNPCTTKRITSSSSTRSANSQDVQIRMDTEKETTPNTPQRLYHPLSVRFSPRSSIFTKSVVDIPLPKAMTPSSIHESAGRTSPDSDKISIANDPESNENTMESPDITMKQEDLHHADDDRPVDEFEDNTEEEKETPKAHQDEEESKNPAEDNHQLTSNNVKSQNLMIKKSFCVKCREKPRLMVRRINMQFPENHQLIFQSGPQRSSSGTVKFSISPEAKYEAYLRDQQSKSSSRANSVLSRTTNSDKSSVSISKKSFTRAPPSSAQSRVSYSLATKWLGEGKDLHSDVLNHHLQQHIPGLKQSVLTAHYGSRERGTSRRALSAAYYSSLTCHDCQNSKLYSSANFSSIDFKNSVNHFEELDFYTNTPQICPNTKTSPTTPKHSHKPTPKSAVEIKPRELSFLE